MRFIPTTRQHLVLEGRKLKKLRVNHWLGLTVEKVKEFQPDIIVNRDEWWKKILYYCLFHLKDASFFLSYFIEQLL